MPLMLEILDNVKPESLQQKTLRARTFESIGFMIAAISEDSNGNQQFLTSVKGVTERLFGLLQ